MKLYIKNMVSLCCKRVVESEMKTLGLYYVSVNLGEAEIKEDITDSQREHLRIALKRFGLELMEDKKTILVERIKNAVVEIVYTPETSHKINSSAYIAGKLHYHYTYLSSLFSEVMGTTIEQFLIVNKIERAKELIFYDEFNLTEISYILNYSSVAHLSNQFKKVTGVAPSKFKKQKENNRLELDRI
ncbi:MAG: AraC family transcriptional regulator [Saprospiraceae bacterium]|nr:AraC family transcriptional regulator [Saprospiraceae bacterium]